MTDFFEQYLSEDPTFHISESGFNKDRQNFYETILALGNGYIGSRSVYEENTLGSSPGTFITGIFDRSGAQVEELVNLPNPVSFMIAVEGEKFDVMTMKVISNKRVLDMKKALLVRKTVYQDAKGRKFLYQSVRFFSMADPHLGAMKVSLKLLKGSARLTMINGLDDSVYNKGGLMLSRKRHFDTVETDKKENPNYTAFSTHSYRNVIAYGDSLTVEIGNKKFSLIDRIHNFELKTGYEITFYKKFAICTSQDYSMRAIKRETLRIVNSAIKKGFDEILREHTNTMDKRWDKTDVKIDGDSEIQKAVRFNIYHILIAVREEYGHFSVGAKTLSGQGYRGHVFWDTEIYMLPFFILCEPETAKKMLMFRYNTLGQARENAREKGFKGAMYPWETTVNGTEQTPRYAKDVDGSIVEVHTQDFEHHITSDVAFGIANYYRNTGDDEFMIKHGAEIVFETARFWASRVEFDKKDKKYHIRHVIGPDEFHVDVDDNVFTNYMAAWNLSYAYELLQKYSSVRKVKNLCVRMNITKKETDNWKNISKNIAVLYSSKYRIYKQFSGYMRKKDVVITAYDNRFMPEVPKYIAEGGELSKTRLLKQADVLLLFCLFPGSFSREEKIRNYNYYISRTIHKSSLSYSMHSILASQLGDRFRAFTYFWASSHLDIVDVAGNSTDGIHAANLGGVWQALIYGYGGLETDRGIIISPRLPGHIKNIEFRFFYMGDLYEVKASNRKVDIRFLPGNDSDKSKKKAIVFNREIELSPYRHKTIEAEGGILKMLTASEIMREENFFTVNIDTPVKEIGTLLIKRKASSVPVVNGNMNLLGIISEKDIIKSTTDEKFEELKARDIMKTEVVTVNHNDSLEKVTKVFTKHPFRRLPVIKGKRVVGIITRRDIIADFLGGYY